MAKDEALFFKPIFKERIWGGTVLKDIYGELVPAGRIGEAWVVSAVPGSESVVASGPYAGRTLAELYRHDRTLFPRAVGDFPLLTKILDAADRLSVQVHPDDEYARVHEHQAGKTECWYVLKAEPGACLVIGHAAKTREELKAAVETGTLESLLATIPVAAAPEAANAPAKSLREIEMDAIHHALEKHRGDKPKAALELGIALKTLYNKLNQYDSQTDKQAS